MARVRDVGIDEVPEEVRPIYRRYVEEYGPFLNQVRIFAHRPVALKHIMGLLLELADESVVDKRYLEICLVAVSKLNACAYCVAHHAPRAVALGLDLATVEHILDPDCPDLDPVDRLVRDFAVAVTTKPQYIRDDMFRAMRQHFSEAEIVELTLRTALCGFFNRFNDALGIDIEEDARRSMLALAGGAT